MFLLNKNVIKLVLLIFLIKLFSPFELFIVDLNGRNGSHLLSLYTIISKNNFFLKHVSIDSRLGRQQTQTVFIV
jgi:hypothetical protein